MFERLSEPGGRARTRDDHGFAFNMGPHALYVGGAAMAALRELGIDPAGSAPPTSGGLAYRAGRLHALPGGAVSLLVDGPARRPEKLEFARLLTPPAQARHGAPERRQRWRRFCAREVRSPRIREVVEAVVRLTSYAHAPERISAGAAIAQLRLGLDPGVRYLDGGWQSMVDALAAARARSRRRAALRRAGRPRGARRARARARGSRTANRVAADAVILALGPDEASALVDDGRHAFLARAARELLCRAGGVSGPRARASAGAQAPVRARHRSAALLLGALRKRRSSRPKARR